MPIAVAVGAIKLLGPKVAGPLRAKQIDMARVFCHKKGKFHPLAGSPNNAALAGIDDTRMEPAPCHPDFFPACRDQTYQDGKGCKDRVCHGAADWYERRRRSCFLTFQRVNYLT